MRTADEPLYTSELPTSPGTDARWLGRRARNVARRPLLLALFTSAGFLVALLAVILAPDRERRKPVVLPPRQDTTPVLALIDRLQEQHREADEALAAARLEHQRERELPAFIDTFPPDVRARRNAIAARVRALSAAIRRASDAPLPASYRALASEPPLTRDSSVVSLVRTLDSLEQVRAQAEAAGAADTAFIALTAQVTAIGDSLVRTAERRLVVLRRELAAISPPPVEIAPPETVDTLPLVAAVDSFRRELDAAQLRLATIRRHNDSLAAVERTIRAQAEQEATPQMLIAAAAVSGLAIGFLVALSAEMRKPAVADGREAEVASGLPVLAHITELSNAGRPARRKADRDVPALIELTSDRYDRLYHRLADPLARLPQLAVLGDNPIVVATVAANLAAAAARTARSTLLLDADFDSGSVSAVLGVRRQPGMLDVLAKRYHWSSVLAQTVVGRDRVIDVLPAGIAPSGNVGVDASLTLGSEIGSIVGRYDTVIVSAPVSRTGRVSSISAVVPDAVVCVRISHSSVRLLQRIVNEARADGAKLRGLVLWSRSIDQAIRSASVAGIGSKPD